MKLSRVTGIDSTWYQKTKVLSRNLAHDFPSLVRRVRRFNRDALPLMVSACSWYEWTLPKSDPRVEADENTVLRSYSHFVAALGLIFGMKYGAEAAEEVDLRILTGELFNLGIFDLDSDWYIKHETIPFRNRLSQIAIDNEYLKKIDVAADERKLQSILLMSRTAFIQWEGATITLSDWIRSILLYEKYRGAAISKNYCSESTLSQAEIQFLGTSPDQLMKALQLLYAYFMSTYGDKKRPPAPFDPDIAIFPEEIEKSFQITNQDLRSVAERLSVNASLFRSFSYLLSDLPPKAWLLSKELWTLHDYPFIRFDDKSPGRLLVCHNPRRLFSKCADLFLNDIVNFYEDELIFGAKERAYSLRGDALEDYVSGVGEKAGLRRAENYLPKDYKGKRPDFIWEGDDWVIIIELKATFRLGVDLTFFSSATLVDSWNKLCEPIDQAKAFIKTQALMGKKFCLATVTSENLIEPVSNFKRLAKQWNFLDGTGIENVTTLTLRQLENALLKHTADNVGKNLQNTWEALDPLSLDTSLLDYNFFNASSIEEERSPHIMKKWAELFPGIKLKTEDF